MTARGWYETRVSHFTAMSRACEQRATRISRLRLAAFFAGAFLLWWGIEGAHAAGGIAGGGALAAFAVLVARHAHVLDARDRADAGRAIALRGLARLDRDWHGLPEIPAPPDLDQDVHPYARDLDLFGHASLTQWLGPAATLKGHATLHAWLLRAAPADTIRARQHAVAELAGDPGWRETLAIEGRLCEEQGPPLERFTAWAGERRSVVPVAVHRIAQILTVAIWSLLAPHLAGLFTQPGQVFFEGLLRDPLWLAPVLPGIALSFAYAPRIYRTFDRASAGDCMLRRYAAMLALVCGRDRNSALLRGLRDRVGVDRGAPRAVSQLARLVEWSELRRAAALLHFPVQALTLWDFHVLFAIDRWRRRFGAAIPGWFDALAQVDALSVLAAIPHDEPEWTTPTIDEAATSCAARALAHPLIPASKRVANDVEVGPPGTMLLVTGSNMSGKSTLLRAIGLNAVLAQAGAPACAAAFAMPPAELQTSIRVQDSLERGLSYFMAALAALKRVVDAAEARPVDSPVMLYLLDEVLQGTNSAERSIAVRGVARHLLRARAIGAMTTHDLSLAEVEPLAAAARLVHFTEQVHADGTMTFDYRLRPGLAASRNAIRLMQLIGIEP